LVENEIGLGGMGIVYSGKRDDDEFEQKVAIKIIKHGFTSEYFLKRFQRERQTLANLKHPNIARLLDGGRSTEDLPYLVMEYIDGIPLTEYCKEKNLSVDEKLKLFNLVCGAVQYAHRNLIVHRDIKPGNILVDKDGSPKLLDFGIAKLLNEDLVDTEETLTQAGIAPFTPEYASPEQINGDKITTVSDVYSLGVILYQILTGEQPYKRRSVPASVLSKSPGEEKILSPSEKVRISDTSLIKESVEKLAGKLKGDLDNIVLKAMHKDQEQRYSSVQELIDDINRYLKGLTVSARGDKISYKVSKFIQRHKAGVAVFVIVNLLAFTGIAAIIYQGNIAAKERDRAQTELKKFEEVNNFLLDMLSSADPGAEGKNVKVYDLLEKASASVNVKLKKYPKVKAAIKQTLGSTYIGIGEYKKAEKLLLESLGSTKKLFGMQSAETAKGYHQLGLCYDWLGKIKLADSCYRTGINIYEEVSGDKPLKGLADNLNDYGSFITNETSYFDSAAAIFKRALKIYALYNVSDGQKAAITINNLAVALHHQNKVDEAEKYYRQAEKILINLYGENHPELGSIYNNLAFIYLDNKKYDASEKAFKKAYKIKLAVLGDKHPSIGLALINLGMLYCIEKDYNKAEVTLNNSIDFFHKIKALKDPLLTYGYYWLGRTYLESNQLKKAEENLNRCLRIRTELYSANNYKIWSVRGELGVCFVKMRKYNEAKKLLDDCLVYYKQEKNSDKKQLTRYTKYSALLYKKLGNNSKAQKYQAEYDSLMKSSSSPE
jgi:eukaryotic-like serine/threonine-protein kinase